jgi:hypothetical protein
LEEALLHCASGLISGDGLAFEGLKAQTILIVERSEAIDTSSPAFAVVNVWGVHRVIYLLPWSILELSNSSSNWVCHGKIAQDLF